MSFPAIRFHGSHHTSSSFSHHIALAAHAFASSFAEMKRRYASEAAARRLERARAKDAEALYRMANEYEALSPNLSAELRFLASRG